MSMTGNSSVAMNNNQRLNVNAETIMKQHDNEDMPSVVEVDYIGADYEHAKRGKFVKRMPQGYNGGRATGK